MGSKIDGKDLMDWRKIQREKRKSKRRLKWKFAFVKKLMKSLCPSRLADLDRMRRESMEELAS